MDFTVTSHDLATQLRDAGMSVESITVLDARHTDRPVFAGVLGGQAVVLKRYTGPRAASTAQAAHDVATALWNSSFGATRRPPGLPRPIAVVAAAGVVVTERLDGPMLGARGDLGGALTDAPEAAGFLADLHAALLGSVSGGAVRSRGTTAIVRSLRRKVAEPELQTVAAMATQVVDRIEREALPTDAYVPTHGDFTTRNVVVTTTGLCLIDLDRVRLAAPGRDVGYWRAWCWTTQLLAGGEPSWAATEPFVRAYADHSPTAAAVLDNSLPHHMAAGLLRIVHGWSALLSRPDLQGLVVREAFEVLAEAPRVAR